MANGGSPLRDHVSASPPSGSPSPPRLPLALLPGHLHVSLSLRLVCLLYEFETAFEAAAAAAGGDNTGVGSYHFELELFTPPKTAAQRVDSVESVA